MLSIELIRITDFETLLCFSCSPGYQVLADSNLVWQVTNALKPALSSRGVWDFHEWYKLSTISKAFQSALADQPVMLKLERQITECEEIIMQHTKLQIVQLELHPQDERASSVLLSTAFRLIPVISGTKQIHLYLMKS